MKNFLLLFFLIFISCKDSSSDVSEKLIKNSKNEVYIALINDCFGEKPFDLKNDEVAQIDSLLIIAVKKMEVDVMKMEFADSIKINLEDYKRQYCAYINKKGEKVVYVNCLCLVRGNAWQKGRERVLGGGKCFFDGTINLSTNSFRDFMINAPR